MNSCVFCQIVSGTSPASFAYEDDVVSAFLDIHPVNPGHLLIVPRLHASALADLPTAVLKHMTAVAQRLAHAMRRADLQCEGVNLLLADGEAAGQEIDHVHLHVIPRFSGDGFGFRFAPGYGGVAPREALDAVAGELRRALDAWPTDSADEKKKENL